MYMIPYTRRSNSSMMDLFDELERSMFGESGRRTPVFSTDIRDEGAHYLLQADLPGFRKEDIDLDVKDGVLTISAKHQADDRTARRQLHLPGAPHRQLLPVLHPGRHPGGRHPGLLSGRGAGAHSAQAAGGPSPVPQDPDPVRSPQPRSGGAGVPAPPDSFPNRVSSKTQFSGLCAPAGRSTQKYGNLKKDLQILSNGSILILAVKFIEC